MQESSGQSKTKSRFVLIVLSVIIFSILMLVSNVVMVVKIKQYTSKITQQERMIENLNSQLEEL